MEEKRKFIKKETIRGSLGLASVLVDSLTGVNYISTGYAITPLLGKDGKPVVDPVI